MKILFDNKCFEKEDFEELEKEGIEVLRYHQKSAEILIPVIVIGGLYFVKSFSSEMGKQIGNHLGNKIGEDVSKIYDKLKKVLSKALNKTKEKRLLIVLDDKMDGINFHVGLEITKIEYLNNFLDDFKGVMNELFNKLKDTPDLMQIGLSLVNGDVKEIYYVDKNKNVYTSLSLK